jgi:hypothetical protein
MKKEIFPPMEAEGSSLILDEQADDEEAKEMYARFGVAYYCASVLEHSIVNALCLIEVIEQRSSAASKGMEEIVDYHFDRSFTKTLGKLKTKLLGHVSSISTLEELVNDLDLCKKERDFLAHHFWREHAEHWFTRAGLDQMVERLTSARDLFSQTTKKIDAAVEPIAERYGMGRAARDNEFELMKRAYLSNPR